MRAWLRARYREVAGRIRRFERREVREFRRWIETTHNLVHLSVLLLVPLLLALVTFVSNSLAQLSFLLFPPLAAGSYILFAEPEGEYASPWRFVGGLTVGALCGWAAIVATPGIVYQPMADARAVSPVGAALAVFLTGASTWALDIEEPAAYSTALLALVTHTTSFEYVVSIAVSSSIVAGVFVVWRDQFYEERARYLYESIKGDDHVLVPMRGEHARATAMLGARLAAAHDAGKVVLLDVLDAEAVDRAREAIERGEPAPDADARAVDVAPDGGAEGDPRDRAEARAAAEAAEALEAVADHVETKVGVPCELAVALDGSAPAATVQRTAREANCDLIAVPYEERHGALSGFVRELFRGDVDVLVHRSADGRTRWKRAMVPVRRPGDVAHSMIDFATRLAGKTGSISVCHCVEKPAERRRAERMLSDLVETFVGAIETRVSRSSIEEFLETNAPQYDVIFLGASMDRSAASRFVSPPTFERLRDLECDVAIVDRNFGR